MFRQIHSRSSNEFPLQRKQPKYLEARSRVFELEPADPDPVGRAEIACKKLLFLGSVWRPVVIKEAQSPARRGGLDRFENFIVIRSYKV